MRLISIILLSLLLVACGAPNVSINRGEFSIMYADIKSTISVWMFRVKQGCEQKKLSPATCADLPQVEIGLKLLDEQAKTMLRKADTEPDCRIRIKITR
jgi:hypothetical protein